MTEIEAAYVAQGYELPAGFTWDWVAEERARYGIDGIRVPIAVAPGCVLWGTPMTSAGKFMVHP